MAASRLRRGAKASAPRAPRRLFTAKRVRLGALATVVAVAIFVAGLHSHGHTHGALRVVDATGSETLIPEWKLGAAQSAVSLPPISAGEFRFELSNADGVPHDFVVVRTDAPAASLPVVDGRVDLAAAGDYVGAITAVDPGGTATSDRIDLAPGNYVLFCNLPGHYNGGMYYQLSVTD